MNIVKQISFLFIILAGLSLSGQSSKSAKNNVKKYPATFFISKVEIDKIATYKAGEVIALKKNKYLNKAELLLNTKNGDTKYMRLKLRYFANSYLTIQVNGEYSTQIFVLSDDKSIFYKNKVEGEGFIMSKCAEEEIISE
ncbi:MAG: hypothetical protein PSX36_10695 [bacterium]|nr:hypothetical protein [bacterium]